MAMDPRQHYHPALPTTLRVLLWLLAAFLGFHLSFRQYGTLELTQLRTQPLADPAAASPPPDAALRFRLVHPRSLESPLHGAYSSFTEELEQSIAFDAVRVQGLLFGLGRSRSRFHAGPLSPEPSKFPTPSPSPSPSPSLSPLQSLGFESPVISGASFGRVGQYFVELFVGSPGQRALLVADTGSDLIWFPCFPCQGTCPKNISVFYPALSTTFKPISCASEECLLIPPPPGDNTCSLRSPRDCNYGYVYGDASESRGIFAYDTVALTSNAGMPGLTIEKVALGCGTRNTGSSFVNVGGVIGLGQGPISFTSQISYNYNSKFSYCLADYFATEPASSFLVFGDRSIESFVREAIQYTPLVDNPLSNTYYYIDIESIHVDGEKLAIPMSTWSIDRRNGDGGSIIDSGTTLTYFREPAYSTIRDALASVIDYPLAPSIASLELCYNVTSVKAPTFPKLSIVFKNMASFSPETSSYFLEPLVGVRCLGFLPNPLSVGMTIVGNLLQQHFYVEYDKAANRLGFALANCKAERDL